MKPIQQSKTLWINMLVMMVAMLTAAMGTPLIENNPELMAYAVAAMGAINIVLRFVTTQPVSLRQQ